ncbi:hypothetical protein D7294_16815 [Streptomyces hoynatensis]|uniref:Uncharacterized protein n=1 Tax=Streptomyces hoynatensis TaxID=1141874 RepID=A0A3A9YXK1_9ACTN|nr:hypothetical protein D7294_16815 [Streptomyces hoynatensis]
MHHRQHVKPVIVTDEFPPTVSAVCVKISGQPFAVVSRAAVADLGRHAEIMRALTIGGISRQAICEVLDGVRS